MITSHNAAKTDNRRYCHRKPSHPLSASQSVSASISPSYPHLSFISTKFFHSKLCRSKSLSASLVCDKDPNTKCSVLTAQKKKTFLKFKSKWDVLGASQGRNILIFHLRSDLSANIMEREERLIGSGGQSRIEC